MAILALIFIFCASIGYSITFFKADTQSEYLKTKTEPITGSNPTLLESNILIESDLKYSPQAHSISGLVFKGDNVDQEIQKINERMRQADGGCEGAGE